MKVRVALSGGVDSAVAAFLLKRQGYECEGFTLQMFDGGTSTAIADAKNVAEKIGIPFRVIDARASFKACVIEPFVNGYLTGGTPNPCVECNRAVKFGSIFAEDDGMVATGHYARTDGEGLYKAADAAKDQSYFLYTLTRAQLRRVLFPLGALTKSEVRAVAAEQGFHNANKPESQDICFVPDGGYAAFIEKFTGNTCLPGDFVSATGQVLGRHNGIIRHTIGQRKGFGISFSRRMYVTGKDAQNNTVTLGGEEELFTGLLTARRVNWLVDAPAPGEPLRLTAKTRYNQTQPAAANVFVTNENQICVEFDEPQRAVTRGQHVVLYNGKQVACGGEIIP